MSARGISQGKTVNIPEKLYEAECSDNKRFEKMIHYSLRPIRQSLNGGQCRENLGQGQ